MHADADGLSVPLTHYHPLPVGFRNPRSGVYLRRRDPMVAVIGAIVERILAERLADGGWNCEAENGSVRSSFDTTINVLDGSLEFERATGGSAEVRTARRSAEEYLPRARRDPRARAGASPSRHAPPGLARPLRRRPTRS
jgi:hypothetical protein